jgi:hypothetical protein
MICNNARILADNISVGDCLHVNSSGYIPWRIRTHFSVHITLHDGIHLRTGHTSHNAPVFLGKDGERYVLNAVVPRLSAVPVDEYISTLFENGSEFIVTRPVWIEHFSLSELKLWQYDVSAYCRDMDGSKYDLGDLIKIMVNDVLFGLPQKLHLLKPDEIELYCTELVVNAWARTAYGKVPDAVKDVMWPTPWHLEQAVGRDLRFVVGNSSKLLAEILDSNKSRIERSMFDNRNPYDSILPRTESE